MLHSSGSKKARFKKLLVLGIAFILSRNHWYRIILIVTLLGISAVYSMPPIDTASKEIYALSGRGQFLHGSIGAPT